MAECLELQYESVAHKKPDVVFVRPRQARMLHQGPAKIVLITLREVDVIVTQLLASKTRAEFIEVRKRVFPDYANLSYIMANSFSLPDNPAIRESAIRQAFQNISRLFGTEGASRLGVELNREAVFCIDTLRRAYRLLGIVCAAGPVPENLREADNKLAMHFSGVVLWAQMHLDCLRLQVTGKSQLETEVLDEIMQGLRASVMAYSYVREAVELRTTRESHLLDGTQDDEHRELLDESYADSESMLDAES